MLVDRLEAVVNGGFRVAMTGKVMVDEREVLDVLDLMRTAIPDEIKQARRISQDREKVLAQAQTEANRLVTQAQERVERLTAEDNLRLMAEERAHELIAQARREFASEDDQINRIARFDLHDNNRTGAQPTPHFRDCRIGRVGPTPQAARRIERRRRAARREPPQAPRQSRYRDGRGNYYASALIVFELAQRAHEGVEF